MAVPRVVLWTIGALLVVGSAVVLYLESGAEDYVPQGIAVAGLVLLVGLLVIGLASLADGPRRYPAIGRRRVTVVDGAQPLEAEAEDVEVSSSRSIRPGDGAVEESRHRRIVRRPNRPTRQETIRR